MRPHPNAQSPRVGDPGRGWEVTAERFTTGWWILLAYPRLYATWLLWAAGVRHLARVHYILITSQWHVTREPHGATMPAQEG